MRLTILPLLAGLTMLAACGGDKPADESSAAAAADTATQGAQAGRSDTGARDFEPIPTIMGGLSLKVVGGDHAGTWDFKDVNGSVREMAGGGTTSTMLQLEAHSDLVHFKLRLSSEEGELLPGRYEIGHAERKLDATYENAGVYYAAVGSASGAVELMSFTDDRATGHYKLTLETLSEPTTTTKVEGRFDMIVQR